MDRSEKKSRPVRPGFSLPPSSLASQGQELRVKHSLAALTRHPERNEQESRNED